MFPLHTPFLLIFSAVTVQNTSITPGLRWMCCIMGHSETNPGLRNFIFLSLFTIWLLIIWLTPKMSPSPATGAGLLWRSLTFVTCLLSDRFWHCPPDNTVPSHRRQCHGRLVCTCFASEPSWRIQSLLTRLLMLFFCQNVSLLYFVASEMTLLTTFHTQATIIEGNFHLCCHSNWMSYFCKKKNPQKQTEKLSFSQQWQQPHPP